ncbi:MAG: ArsA family ATPase [Chlamydiota bacterium]
MLENIIDQKELRLIFVGGKGGVGKTTTSVALAFLLAEKSPNDPILLISTDPAHSLGDSLKIKLNDGEASLKEFPNLKVRELNTAQLAKDFYKKYRAELSLLLERGTYFDAHDTENFLDLSIPGADEVMAISEIVYLLENKELKHLVVDTAPTGHTLSLLNLPKVLDAWLSAFDLMQEKHHILQAHFAGRETHDSVDLFLKKMHEDIKKAKHWFHHATKTDFIVVMLPENLSFTETKRLIFSLKEKKIPVHTLVVNGLASEGDCPICLRMQKNQKELLSKTIDCFFDFTIVQIPLASKPIQGIPSLRWFSDRLIGKKEKTVKKKEELFKEKKSFLSIENSPFKKSPIKIDKLLHGNPNLVIVGGKGGVGKTTVSATTAICFAEKHPSKKFLLFSIDPAHSLSDCLNLKIGDQETKILKNLYAIELDASSLLKTFKQDYIRDLNNLFEEASQENSSSGMDNHDRKIFCELLEMSPPGLEEIMALYKVILLLEKEGDDAYDTIIFDTAPTGHLFRFLELPQLLLKWLSSFFEFFLKYKQVASLQAIEEKLIKLSKEIRKAQKILQSSEQTRTIIVTKPEYMVVTETERFIKKLQQLQIPANLMAINMIRDNENCDVCYKKQVEQIPLIKDLIKLAPKEWITISFSSEDLRGIEALKKFGKSFYQSITPP